MYFVLANEEDMIAIPSDSLYSLYNDAYSSDASCTSSVRKAPPSWHGTLPIRAHMAPKQPINGHNTFNRPINGQETLNRPIRAPPKPVRTGWTTNERIVEMNGSLNGGSGRSVVPLRGKITIIIDKFKRKNFHKKISKNVAKQSI